MKKTLKTLLAILLVLCLSMGLAAFAYAETAVNITVAIEATGDIPEEFQNQVDRFNANNGQGITVSILTYAGSEAYQTAITGQIAGQSAPDVILLDGGKQIQEFAQSDVLVSLDELLSDIAPYFEKSLIDAFMVEGTLYGLPKDYNTSVLFYQKDMLEAAGLALPATIADFLNAVATLSNDGVYGFGCDPKINYLYPFMATMGADFIGADGEIDEAKLTSEEHQAALQMFKDMFAAKQATTPYLEGAGWDGELFGNQKVAFLYGGSWVTGVISDTEKAGVASLPVQNAPFSMLYTAGWAITKQSKAPEAAAAFIRFLSSDEELVAGNQAGLIGLPPTQSAMDKLIEVKADDPFLPVYRDVVGGGVAFGLLDSKFVDNYNKALEGMLYNDASVEDTIAATAAGL